MKEAWQPLSFFIRADSDLFFDWRMVLMAKRNTEKTKTVGGGITALYVRVSTDAQYEEGYSIDAQVRKLKQWCDLKDYENYEVYEDGGWSGSNLERPEMKRLISDITAHRVDRVVVYKLDRLSRSQKDTLFLLEELFIPNNVEFYSMNENFDTGTSYGKAMIGILSVFAQLERENIRERTRMGMQERVKAGYWMGGNGVPFGYDYDSNQDILVPNEHANDVRAIYDLYLKGYTTTQLAKMFPVSGDRQIGLILDRVTYLGKIQYKGEVFQGRHQALVDENTWHRAQLERKRRSSKNAVTSSYLLTGLLVCGKCGAKMRYQTWSSGQLKIVCYSRQRSKMSLVKDPNCDNPRIDARELEKVVTDDLFRLTDRITVSEQRFPAANSDREAGIKVLQRKYDAISAKIKRLYNLFAEDPDELLLQTVRENQEELASISAMLNSEKASVEAVNDIRQRNNAVMNLRNRWDSLTIKERQRAVRICIGRIILTDDKIDIEYLI